MSSSIETKNKNTKGFTIVELLITIAIVTLITAIIMVRYSSFDSSILLNNQAYEIALDIRETQVRSVSVRLSEDDSLDDRFESNYGLYFEVGEPGYELFIESDSDGTYNTGDGDINIATLLLDNRFEISNIYDENGTPTDWVSVYFARPNFDAVINVPGKQGGESVSIELVSKRNPGGLTKTVSIYRSGQISID